MTSTKPTQPRSRRQRKPPSIPRSRRHRAFFPTYRYAIDWMQHHQEVLETAFNLAEIHPKLIQHKVCDRLWEFISKVGGSCGKYKNGMQPNDSRGSSSNAENREVPPTVYREVHIPVISVTSTQESQSPVKKRINTVYVCGNLCTDKWHRLFISLSEKYSVRCAPQKLMLNEPEEANRWIFDTDCVLFLLDSSSIADPHLIEKLQSAKTWNLPVIFVRDPGYVLPKPLPGHIHNAGPIHIVDTPTPDNRSETSEITPTPTPRTPDHFPPYSPTHDNDIDITRRSSRQKQTSTGAYLSVASTPYPRTTSTPIKLYTKAPRDQLMEMSPNPSPVFGRSTSVLSDEDLLDTLRQDADYFTRPRPRTLCLANVVCEGYSGSVLYHSLYHNDCIERIIYTIETISEEIDQEKTAPDTNAHIQHTSSKLDPLLTRGSDNAAINSLAKELHPTAADDELISNIQNNSETSKSSSFSEEETTYVVYSGDRSSPTIVHWPRMDTRVDSTSSSCDSIGFQDIDLSRNLNSIDLFSDENS